MFLYFSNDSSNIFRLLTQAHRFAGQPEPDSSIVVPTPKNLNSVIALLSAGYNVAMCLPKIEEFEKAADIIESEVQKTFSNKIKGFSLPLRLCLWRKNKDGQIIYMPSPRLFSPYPSDGDDENELVVKYWNYVNCLRVRSLILIPTLCVFM